MLPRQLFPSDKSLRHARKTIITCDRGRRRLAFSCYKWGGGRSPRCPSLPCLLDSSSLLHCLQRHRWHYKGSFLSPRRERLLARGPAPRRPSAAAAVRASMPRPPPWPTVMAAPRHVEGIVPAMAVQLTRGGVQWWRGLPARASIQRRCRRSLSSGRRTRPATGSSFRTSSPANCRPLVQADSGCRRMVAAQGLLGCSRVFRRGQHSPSPRLVDVFPCARSEQAVHPPLQVRRCRDPLREGVWGR